MSKVEGHAEGDRGARRYKAIALTRTANKRQTWKCLVYPLIAFCFIGMDFKVCHQQI